MTDRADRTPNADEEATAPRAILLVLEPRARWSDALRRWAATLGDLPLAATLREVSSTEHCREYLDRHPASLVVCELREETLDEGLHLVMEVARRYPTARTAVVTRFELGMYEPLARELGAIHFATSPFDAAELCRVARRHLRRQNRRAYDGEIRTGQGAAPSDGPRNSQLEPWSKIVSRVRGRLPWARYATELTTDTSPQ
jgi:DNA-binding NtrC family response regulator